MKKETILISGILFFTLLSLIQVMGAVNVLSPASGQNATSLTLMCSYANNTNDVVGPNATNSSFYQNASGSLVAITCSSFSCTTTNCSCSASASQLTDGLGQKFTCIIGNVTKTIGSNSNATKVNIYTSTPTCSFSKDKENVKYMDMLGIETTQSSTKDALSSINYSWSLFDNNNKYVRTSSSSAPTFSGSDFNDIGTFTLSLVVSDDFQNVVSCSNESIYIKGADGKASTAISVTQTAQKTKSNLVWWIIGILVFLALAIVIVFFIISGVKNR